MMTSITVAKLNTSFATTCSTLGVDARTIQSLDYSSNNEKNTDSLKSAINKPYQKFGDTS